MNLGIKAALVGARLYKYFLVRGAATMSAQVWISVPHCNENPIYVFIFWELRGLSPSFHIHVSVSDLYIPRISPHISCSRTGRLIVEIYKSLTYTRMWKLGLWPHNSFSGNICFEFLVLVLGSAFTFKPKHQQWEKISQRITVMCEIQHYSIAPSFVADLVLLRVATIMSILL